MQTLILRRAASHAASPGLMPTPSSFCPPLSFCPPSCHSRRSPFLSFPQVPLPVIPACPPSCHSRMSPFLSFPHALLPVIPAGTPSCHSRMPSSCHSRRHPFLSFPQVFSGNPSSTGIRGKENGKKKDAGCPITLVPDICYRGTVGHDRERPLPRPSRKAPSCHPVAPPWPVASDPGPAPPPPVILSPLLPS